MGKGSKKDKKNNGAAASAKCTCEHPYQCSCGNRPERPSKGHKWYPEEQVWAGKGHKQKGASGQTASVAKQATTTSSGQTLIKQHEKLPSQLLGDYCNKQKKPRPKFKNVSSAASTFKYRVIVCDGKNADKDQFFVPHHSVVNEEQAREEAALLALLHLTPNIPHERRLPEPYKSTWLHAVQQAKASKSADGKKKKAPSNNMAAMSNSKPAATKASGSAVASTSLTLVNAAGSFTSQAERRKHRQEKQRRLNERIRKHENIRMANQNPQVFMSATIRKQIESLLRGLVVVLEDHPDDTVDVVTDDCSDLQVYIEHRLHSEGFTKQQARSSYREVSRRKPNHFDSDDEAVWDNLYEECLQWLLVHVDEEDLPEGFDPRGRTLDVVVPVSHKTKTQNDPSVNDFAATYGLTVKEGAALFKKASADSKQSVLDFFWMTMLQVANVSLPRGPDKSAENIDIARDELEALDAIYGSECQVASVDGFSTIRIALEDGEKQLEVVVENDAYPAYPPKRVSVSGRWEKPNGAALHIELAKSIASLPLGEPMIFSIHAQVQDLLQDDLQDDGLLRHLDDRTAQHITKTPQKPNENGKPNQTSNGHDPRRAKLLHRRPREKGKNFWTLHPKDTPPAAASPKVSETMRRTRVSLPAFATRADFLAAVEKSRKTGRVLLVTGETGSGTLIGNWFVFLSLNLLLLNFLLIWCIQASPLNSLLTCWKMTQREVRLS